MAESGEQDYFFTGVALPGVRQNSEAVALCLSSVVRSAHTSQNKTTAVLKQVQQWMTAEQKTSDFGKWFASAVDCAAEICTALTNTTCVQAVDDLLLSSDTPANCMRASGALHYWFKTFGLQVNWQKSSRCPQKKVKFGGMQVRVTPVGDVRLSPDEKVIDFCKNEGAPEI